MGLAVTPSPPTRIVGRVVTPTGIITHGRVDLADGRIVAVGRADLTDDRPTDGAGWVVPGFIDLQVNGGAGVDLTTQPERLGELAADLVRQGVTAFLPTVITAVASRRVAALAAWADRAIPSGAAEPLGWHFEGPMIAANRLGAHPADARADPSLALIEGWTPSAGVVMVTMAPELRGADEVIAALVGRGVVVAIGHTDATETECHHAVTLGASYVTHLYNAMRPFGHRDPGPVGACLGGDRLVVGLIADGVHVDDAAVRIAWRALGPDRLTLVTDAVAARGGGTGRLGSIDVGVDAATGAVRTGDGALAGSVLTLDEALRRLVAVTGATVPEAVATVTSTPAAVLGLTDRGVLEPDRRADVVVLDDELRVRTVLIAGEVVWRS